MSEPIPDTGRQRHWQAVYSSKRENEVSWFEETPALSVQLIEATGATKASAIIDVGGGASRLVDTLLAAGYADVIVLDIADSALDAARARLGDLASRAHWIAADITRWKNERRYDVWHDRAVFHFLTEPADRAAYFERLAASLAPGGHAIIGTFAPDGPERCSGLPVVRYDEASLARSMPAGFAPVGSQRFEHVTPWGAVQSFQFTTFRKE